MATILDGKALAQKIQSQLQQRVENLRHHSGIIPGLAVVLVGNDPASAVYVSNKEKAALKIGMKSEIVRLHERSGETEILLAVKQLNERSDIHGIIVQMPLPAGTSTEKIIQTINPAKDADGLHPQNLGALCWGGGMRAPRPCTPLGIMTLLDSHTISCQGKHAAVLGRSAIVGKPMALMLLERHATVTICHSRTPDLQTEVKRADILVVAIGVAQKVQGDWLKPGAVVVDVGMNRLNGKLVGDVDFDSTAKVASAITPVPGGVGPMTVTMLLANTIAIAERNLIL